jgi:hypothetical protein
MSNRHIENELVCAAAFRHVIHRVSFEIRDRAPAAKQSQPERNHPTLHDLELELARPGPDRVTRNQWAIRRVRPGVDPEAVDPYQRRPAFPG